MVKKNLMITGGLGFIGFNFICEIIKKYPDINIINIDNETYAGRFLLNKKNKILNIFFFNKNNQFIKTIKCNINNAKKIEELVNTYEINTIINFAAESHVDNSIKTPDIFIKSNINGTQTL